MDYYETKEMSEDEIREAFQKCFTRREGRIALSFLHRITTRRCLGPDCTDSKLRYLEGQRHLVSYISAMADCK